MLEDPVPMNSGSVYSGTVEISQGDNGYMLANGIDDNDSGQSLYIGADGNWCNWIGLTTSMRLNLGATPMLKKTSMCQSLHVSKPN